MTPTQLIPARGMLLVRPVRTADTFAGGRIIVPDEAREKLAANQVEVVAVGAFAECDPARSRAERKCEREHTFVSRSYGDRGPLVRVHAHPIRVGAWLLVRPRSTIAGPDPERTEYFVHQDDVLGIFHDEISNVETD